MQISQYADHVAETDRFKDHSREERQRISIYGLVSEIGSVVSAVKKQKLEKADRKLVQHELREELGDIIWYCFALAEIEGIDDDDIFARELKALSKSLKGDDEQSTLLRKSLNPDKIKEFHQRAETFPCKKKGTFQEFREIAHLTARTESDDLVDTSLIELMSLSAQLMRPLLPKSEKDRHSQIPNRPALKVLEEIAWHLAAIATVYDLSLDEIASKNIQKTQSQRPAAPPTSPHDENWPEENQKFPRPFEVKFLTVEKGRSRMYLDGRQLGDDLTDNSDEEDGYRFHDALHLSNIAHLGWSPVFRGLMKRKRKADSEVDEIQDGARAQIVEEAVLKMIHSEGKEIAKIMYPDLEAKDRPMFPDEVYIPFSFFKLIQRYVEGLEVDKNSFAEWRAAIRDGFRIYKDLVKHGQGTVTVDLNKREITFCPEVYVDIAGAVMSIGSCTMPLSEFGKDAQDKVRSDLTKAEIQHLGDNVDANRLAHHVTAKHAILQALSVDCPNSEHFDALSLTETESRKFSVKAESPLKEMMWQRGIITFKTSFSQNQNSVCCTALALSDIPKK